MPIYELDGIGPTIPDDGNYWIAPSAQVIGRVELAAGASVWWGAVLRGDNDPLTIGADTNIQDGSILHTDIGYPLTIGADCTIGHAVILHGCTIGDNSLVGMGATILNGAKIGKNSLVGANALITEGTEFPDNSLIVGMPAKVVRTLDEAAADGIRESAQHYVQNWRRYASGLREIPETKK